MKADVAPSVRSYGQSFLQFLPFSILLENEISGWAWSRSSSLLAHAHILLRKLDARQMLEWNIVCIIVRFGERIYICFVKHQLNRKFGCVNFHHYHRKHRLTKTTLEHTFPPANRKYIPILHTNSLLSFAFLLFAWVSMCACSSWFSKWWKFVKIKKVSGDECEEKWWNVDVAI